LVASCFANRRLIALNTHTHAQTNIFPLFTSCIYLLFVWAARRKLLNL